MVIRFIILLCVATLTNTLTAGIILDGRPELDFVKNPSQNSERLTENMLAKLEDCKSIPIALINAGASTLSKLQQQGFDNVSIYDFANLNSLTDTFKRLGENPCAEFNKKAGESKTSSKPFKPEQNALKPEQKSDLKPEIACAYQDRKLISDPCACDPEKCGWSAKDNMCLPNFPVSASCVSGSTENQNVDQPSKSSEFGSFLDHNKELVGAVLGGCFIFVGFLVCFFKQCKTRNEVQLQLNDGLIQALGDVTPFVEEEISVISYERNTLVENNFVP